MDPIFEESTLDCGEDGLIATQWIWIEGEESVDARNNYMEIRSRWGELWPQARRVIFKMLAEYDRPAEIPDGGAFLSIGVPGAPIAGGEEWGIGLEFDDGDVWDAVFIGWEISEEDSQPVF